MKGLAAAWVATIFTTCALPASGEAWLEKCQSGTTIYFSFASPARVERFDLQTATFSPTPISLAGEPSAFAADDTGVYAAFGEEVYRYPLSGGNPAYLLSSPATIQALVLVGSQLIVQHTGDQFISADKSTGVVIDTVDFHYTMLGLSVDQTLRRIYGSFINGSPTDIVRFDINLDGTFGFQQDSFFHGELRTGFRTFTTTDAGFVLDSSGTAYDSDLTETTGSAAGTVIDAAVENGKIVVALGNDIVSFDDQFIETGLYTPLQPAAGVALQNGIVYGFSPALGGTGIAVSTIPLDAMPARPVAVPINPVGHPYVPDQVLADSRGVIYILDAQDRMVFAWSSDLMRYVQTIPLSGEPDLMTYVSDSDTLYFGYLSGRMSQVQLGAHPAESPFANTPNRLTGLCGTDNWLFAVNGNDASVARYTYIYDVAGHVTDERDFSGYSSEYIWSRDLRRVYHLWDDASPNDLLYDEVNANGTYGAYHDSPYHGDFSVAHPIRVSPAGDRIIIGTGRIYDSSLISIALLPETIDDAAWLDDNLYTMHPDGTDATRIQRWDGSNYAQGIATVVDGSPVALVAVPRGLVVVTYDGTAPVFTVLDASLRTSGNGGGGGGCFIATAAYGTPLEQRIHTLRALRDTNLLTTTAGAAFTDAYYRLSPRLAEYVATYQAPRAAARVTIGAMLAAIDHWQGLILTVAVAGYLTIIIRRKIRVA